MNPAGLDALVARVNKAADYCRTYGVPLVTLLNEAAAALAALKADAERWRKFRDRQSYGIDLLAFQNRFRGDADRTIDAARAEKP